MSTGAVCVHPLVLLWLEWGGNAGLAILLCSVVSKKMAMWMVSQIACGQFRTEARKRMGAVAQSMAHPKKAQHAMLCL